MSTAFSLSKRENDNNNINVKSKKQTRKIGRSISSSNFNLSRKLWNKKK